MSSHSHESLSDLLDLSAVSIDDEDATEELYTVEKIVGKRTVDGGTEYLVKWLGYDSSENSWEPEANVAEAEDKVKEFEAQRKNKKDRKRKNGGNGSPMPQKIARENIKPVGQSTVPAHFAQKGQVPAKMAGTPVGEFAQIGQIDNQQLAKWQTGMEKENIKSVGQSTIPAHFAQKGQVPAKIVGTPVGEFAQIGQIDNQQLAKWQTGMEKALNQINGPVVFNQAVPMQGANVVPYVHDPFLYVPPAVAFETIPAGGSNDHFPSAASFEAIPAGGSNDHFPSAASFEDIPAGDHFLLPMQEEQYTYTDL